MPRRARLAIAGIAWHSIIHEKAWSVPICLGLSPFAWAVPVFQMSPCFRLPGIIAQAALANLKQRIGCATGRAFVLTVNLREVCMSDALNFSSDPAVQSAGRWFWWIAGLSLVNTVLIHSGSSTSFVVGLGMTMIVDVALASQKLLAISIDALVVGFFVFVGLFAARGKAWAFYLGLVVYGLDALIYAKFSDWMPVAFHGLAIFFIVRGLTRLRAVAPEAGGAQIP